MNDQSKRLSNKRTKAILAATRLHPRVSFFVIAASGALSTLGTSSMGATKEWGYPYVFESNGATSSRLKPLSHKLEQAPATAQPSTQQSIAKLRRISGLTWAQLGQLFEVSRRSIHFWASGKPLNAANEERLMRVLDVVSYADRGNMRQTRTALFSAHKGITPFDMLVAQQFSQARATLGQGHLSPKPKLSKLSPATIEARKPPSPEKLIDAKNESLHRQPSRIRIAQTARNKRHADD